MSLRSEVAIVVKRLKAQQQGELVQIKMIEVVEIVIVLLN